MPDGSDERRIISEKNCQFLLDDSDYKEASKPGIRSRIRKRIRAGIGDFSFLYDQITGDEFRKTVYPPESRPPSSEAIRDGIAFLYKAAKENPRIDSDQLVEAAVEKAERDHGRTATVDIETEPIPVEELIERVADGDPTGDLEYLEALRKVQGMGFEKDEDDPFSHRYRSELTDRHQVMWEEAPDSEESSDGA
jgi:hypothetical protein